jgi:hypothetical protein
MNLDPTANQPPDTGDSLTPGAPQSQSFGDLPTSVILRNFFAAMNEVGDDAQDAYQAALAEVREHADEMVLEIATTEKSCDPGDYQTRWALVHLAAEIRNSEALPFLRRVVLTPIPPEGSDDPHSFSTVAEETILRTTAAEGVGYLAAAGDRQALESLFEFLQVPSLSIRRATVQAILDTREGPQLRDRIAAFLPNDQRFLLDLGRPDIREVPQIEDPQRHLRDAARQVEKGPPDRLPGEGSNPTRQDERPPRAG